MSNPKKISSKEKITFGTRRVGKAKKRGGPKEPRTKKYQRQG